ncbi:sulfatase [Geothermobacter hydrogeniphilus]|uniref:Sulfatase n=1 Tax=Geothermobacter hydrogeniphilus TaxID=1969733 RepID=A0A2K2HB35_9BACT|nr:LTA synthase family protein [Geothermobacter hydrogeniphilus]PNU20512.1 sulfatase [Geothermobacter hydrogeniphilus]
MKSSRFQLLGALYLLSLVLFFAIRLLLLIVSRQDASPSLPQLLHIFATGALFDSGFFAYALIAPALYLWLLPQRLWRSRIHAWWLKLVVFVSLYAACFTLVAEYLFWDEFQVRFNFISIDYLIYRREVTDNIVQSYPVVWLFLGMFVGALLLYQPLRKPLARALNSEEPFLRRGLIALLLLLLPLSGYFTLGQPLRRISANNYINELASNGPYQFVAAFRNNELDYRQFYATLPDDQAAQLLRREVAEPNARFVSDAPYDIRRDIHNTGPEQHLNIILITVESLSSDFLDYFGNGQHLTPNLDALIDKSLFFDNFYATGTRTTRGLEAVNLSIPPTPGRSIIKRIGRETDQWSLGDVLDEKGYHSFFAYGGRSYFENMNAFYAANGYQIVDQTSVPDTEISFSNAWGMSDEDLFRQVMKVADREQQAGTPFFIQVMTTSNHRPYTYPEGRIDIPSGHGRNGAVKYTDYALGQLLSQSEQHPWFDDTLFVILADHQAGSAGKHDLPVARYHIPLWIYAPRHIPPRKVSTLSSQVDLAPTLLGLLNMSYRSCFFGHDVLAEPAGRGRALIANYQNLGLYDGKQMAILEPRRQIRLQSGLDGGKLQERAGSSDHDPLVRRDIGYYQGAAAVYRQHLNSWRNRNRK